MLRHVTFRLFMTLRALWAPTVLGVAGAVSDADGRVLLVRHRYNPGWRLPGGGVDRGETPDAAIRRELREEVGLEGGACEFVGLYTRKAGWATSVVALYRIAGGTVNFRPNLEISAILFADPETPPLDATPATLRRFQELRGASPLSPHW